MRAQDRVKQMLYNYNKLKSGSELQLRSIEMVENDDLLKTQVYDKQPGGGLTDREELILDKSAKLEEMKFEYKCTMEKLERFQDALELLKIENSRSYEVIEIRYLRFRKYSNLEAAEELNCGIRTVERYLSYGIRDLAIILHGYNAI